MGKKGGSQTRPVFDYHLSIDYGVCMGRIDHFNKMWIKDKTIFCGLYRARSDISVNLPELYGGDDSEGGVRGVIELYPGNAEQYSSWELSKRFGLDPVTAPGYRGVAHAFLRGDLDQATITNEIEEAGDTDGLFSLLNDIFKQAFGTTSNSPGSRSGFKWTANNPYLPDTKISLSRLPKIGVADQYRAIWPGATLDENGNIFGLATVDQTIPATDTGIDLEGSEGVFDIWNLVEPTSVKGGVVDLHEIGFTQSQIDTGQAIIVADWALTLLSGVTYGIGNTTMTTQIKFHSVFPESWDDPDIAPVSGEEALVDVDLVGAAAPGTQERGDVATSQTRYTPSLGPVTAPVGSRYIQVRALFELGTNTYALPPSEQQNYHDEWLYDNPNAGFSPGSFGEGAINVTVGDPVVVPDPEPSILTAPPDDTFAPFVQGKIGVESRVPSKLGTIIDLVAAGFSEEEIDAGLIYFTGDFSGNVYQTVPALPSGTTQPRILVKQHQTRPTDVNDTDGLPFYSEEESGVSSWSLAVSESVAPTTRFLEYRAEWTTAVGKYLNATANDWQVGIYTYGTQHCSADDLIGPLPDANPARIIWECLTDPEWGKGEDPALIDDASFNTAAATLFDERFGLSFAFFEQDTIENFISEVLDHIQGFLYQDPATGLWTLTLLRDDYDAASVPLWDETNCLAENRKRRLWGETINEIVVSYTDPNTEKGATVSAWDLGNIAIQGDVISETRDYYGIRNPLLATVVANRDVRAAGYPLFSCTVKLPRSEWAIRPGDVRRLSWPDDQIEEVVVRVMSVDYGKPSDRTITVQVTEDIFSIERAQYGAPQTSEWVNVESAPTTLDAQAAFTVPLPALVRAGAIIEDIDADYPVVTGALFADEDGNKPTTIEAQTTVVKNNGTTKVEKIAELVPTYSAPLMSPLAQEAESTISKSQIDVILRRDGEEGMFFMLGFREALSELIMLESYDEDTRLWTVKRGMWDTVPLAWGVGIRLWHFAESLAAIDPKERTSGTEQTYYLLPRTSLGTLDFDDANPLTVTFTDRPFAPFRPANAELDGQGFGGVVVREAPFPTEIVATWKNRNRTTEDQVSLAWDDDSAAMESGQTVTLRIMDDLGNTHMDITGLTGETYTIDAADLPPGLEGYVQFLSERDGFTSTFGARRYFDIRPPSGYGLAYGLDYGGDPDA